VIEEATTTTHYRAAGGSHCTAAIASIFWMEGIGMGEPKMRTAHAVPQLYGQSVTGFDVIVEGENHIHRHARRAGIASDFRATYEIFEASGDKLPGLWRVTDAQTLEKW
jgi:hypothetical protein